MYIPLAERVRPQKIDEILGQQHILAQGKILRNLIESKKLVNMIFYGPPGTGKTTVAKIAAENSGMSFKALNCTSLSTADIKDVINNSIDIFSPNGTLLYLDEIQYLNKKQQQILLESMENGLVTVIASTTENPYFSVYNAVLSRCVVFEFKSVSHNDINHAVRRALNLYSEDTGEKIECEDKIIEEISKITGGDVRKAINFLDTCLLGAKMQNGTKKITEDLTQSLFGNFNLSYEKSGDNHYDLLSAFQKSMRGSDPDAAIYYLAMLLEFKDLTAICRRLMVCACEDVGLSYPQIIPIVKSAVDIANQVGMPEARIPLADAVILVSLSPKSNSAYNAINSAQRDIKSGKIFGVPRHLQNVHCDGKEEPGASINNEYIYPHAYPYHWVKQDYLPKGMKNTKYYEYGANKTEEAFKAYWRKIKDEKM
jgi:ATPase related to the helicase subunit of the Holliday junction resolvase